jgi:hypothetical protein
VKRRPKASKGESLWCPCGPSCAVGASQGSGCFVSWPPQVPLPMISSRRSPASMPRYAAEPPDFPRSATFTHSSRFLTIPRGHNRVAYLRAMPPRELSRRVDQWWPFVERTAWSSWPHRKYPTSLPFQHHASSSINPWRVLLFAYEPLGLLGVRSRPMCASVCVAWNAHVGFCLLLQPDPDLGRAVLRHAQDLEGGNEIRVLLSCPSRLTSAATRAPPGLACAAHV